MAGGEGLSDHKYLAFLADCGQDVVFTRTGSAQVGKGHWKRWGEGGEAFMISSSHSMNQPRWEVPSAH